jgi:hypothetical protein
VLTSDRRETDLCLTLKLKYIAPSDLGYDLSDRVGFSTKMPTVRYGTLRCATVRHGALRCATVRHGELRCATVRYGAPRCVTVRYGALRCATVRHGALRCSTVSPFAVQHLLHSWIRQVLSRSLFCAYSAASRYAGRSRVRDPMR